ncbi:MAG: hypothetical protein IJ150_10560 [Bacteroidales bacterium]|nr:hypothetical protein [Bacteroidales bacterium]
MLAADSHPRLIVFRHIKFNNYFTIHKNLFETFLQIFSNRLIFTISTPAHYPIPAFLKTKLFATLNIFATFAIDIMNPENQKHKTMDSGISMMTTQRLEQILKNGESYNIEYKTCPTPRILLLRGSL